MNPALASNPNIAPLANARNAVLATTKGALNVLMPLVGPVATIGVLYLGFRTMLHGVLGTKPTFINKAIGG
jgi:hypothetical protein